jgi:AcrR family transcriptional regulator
VTGSFRGRQAEARRNDERILEAALEVFAADPQAPMSAVGERAGVGQASLYRRYPSKEALLAHVCERGMTRMREAALAAVRASGDPYDALAGFLRWYLESGTPRLGDLLGSFAPEEHLFDLARETNEAMQALVERSVKAGRVRADVTGADLTLIVTQISTLAAADGERAAALRDRYLTLALQGLALRDAPDLPGPPPDAAELEQPWREQQRRVTPGSQPAESSRRPRD